ncbi:P-loop containing nucleoside triphosphate hydrolase protein, partial [Dichotomocladium elegans]
KSFQFDHVFRPSSTQDEIFSSVGEKLVRTFVEGYNVTILAYGQTSSGKTYTMGTASTRATGAGEEGLSEHEGIVPRAVSLLFSLLDDAQVKVSFIEIYNEELVDLLNPSPVSERPPITIREDVKGQLSLAGVKELPVKRAADVLQLLQQGTRNRATGATDMNEKSSRSHAILTLTLRRSHQDHKAGAATKSKLHFVDLAGSERLKRTAAQGDRRREGISINAGLLALGNVISVLTKGLPHVPYRDSKLTRLLQDSLGGNSQTLMIACVSPTESNLSETVNTLQYASRARHIKNK